ncbi:MAG: c-type cytochrome domain-containing protein, partial [Verrucomicrobiota bacterium]
MRRTVAYLVIAPLFAITVKLAWLAYLTPPAPEPTAPPQTAEERAARQFAADFRMKVRPFVQTYCVDCHGGAKPEAELDLAGYAKLDAVMKDPDRWSQVLERVKAGEMPPEDAKKH